MTCESCNRSWYSAGHLGDRDEVCPACGGRLVEPEEDADPPPAA
jgi:hypothetical protein